MSVTTGQGKGNGRGVVPTPMHEPALPTDLTVMLELCRERKPGNTLRIKTVIIDDQEITALASNNDMRLWYSDEDPEDEGWCWADSDVTHPRHAGPVDTLAQLDEFLGRV